MYRHSTSPYTTEVVPHTPHSPPLTSHPSLPTPHAPTEVVDYMCKSLAAPDPSLAWEMPPPQIVDSIVCV